MGKDLEVDGSGLPKSAISVEVMRKIQNIKVMAVVSADEFPPRKYMSEQKQWKLIVNMYIQLLESLYGYLVLKGEELRTVLCILSAKAF